MGFRSGIGSHNNHDLYVARAPQYIYADAVVVTRKPNIDGCVPDLEVEDSRSAQKRRQRRPYKRYFSLSSSYF